MPSSLSSPWRPYDALSATGEEGGVEMQSSMPSTADLSGLENDERDAMDMRGSFAEPLLALPAGLSIVGGRVLRGRSVKILVLVGIVAFGALFAAGRSASSPRTNLDMSDAVVESFETDSGTIEPLKEVIAPPESTQLVDVTRTSCSEEQMVELFLIVSEEFGSNEKDLRNQTSPQYRAVNWLCYLDDMELLWNETERLELRERYAVVVVLFAMHGKKKVERPFLAGTSVCSWNRDDHYFGIACGDNGVIQLNLGETFLHGYLPEELGLLTNLEKLSSTYASIDGELPASLLALSNLRYIDFEYGTFTKWRWPTFITHFERLEHLGVPFVVHPISLPTEIGLLTHLTHLTARENTLVGTIPAELGSLTKLTWLVLQENDLHGSIPSELGMLTQLTILGLSDNEYISGSIPSELGMLTQLTFLGLSLNKDISGSIPSELFQLTKLERLDMSGIDVSGSLDGFCDGQTVTIKYLSYDCRSSMPRLTCSCCTSCDGN